MRTPGRSAGRPGHHGVSTPRAAAFALALVALAVLLGSQGILRQRPVGLRSHPTRRLKAPTDLLEARVAKSKDQASREQSFRQSLQERLGLTPGSAALVSAPRSPVPALAALWLAQPEYLRKSSDPNIHTGPPT